VVVHSVRFVFCELTDQVRQDMENAYWELAYTTRSIRIIHETTAAFDRLLDVAVSLYKSGRTSYQDVIKVTIKIEELNQERVSLENKADNGKIRLLELMNLPADTRLGPVKTAPLSETIPPPEKLISLAREHRQELAAIRFQISKLQSMVELAESMKQAKLPLGFSYFEADHVNTAGSGAPQQPFVEKIMASIPSEPMAMYMSKGFGITADMKAKGVYEIVAKAVVDDVTLMDRFSHEMK